MKKLLVTFIFIIVSASYIIGMEQNIPQTLTVLTHEAKKSSNIDLSKELYRNDLTEQRIKELQDKGFDLKYRKPTDHSLSPLSFWLEKCHPTILTARSEHRNNNRVFLETKNLLKQQCSILLTFLELGNHDDFGIEYPVAGKLSHALNVKDGLRETYSSLLWFGILNCDSDTIKRLLILPQDESIRSYDLHNNWRLAVKQKDEQIINLLITHFTPKECQEALNIIAKMEYQPEIMLQLINHGANPHETIQHLEKTIISAYKNENFINVFKFLSTQAGFDQQTLDMLHAKKESFVSFINTTKSLNALAFQDLINIFNIVKYNTADEALNKLQTEKKLFESLIDFINTNKPSETSSINNSEK